MSPLKYLDTDESEEKLFVSFGWIRSLFPMNVSLILATGIGHALPTKTNCASADCFRSEAGTGAVNLNINV